MLKLVVIYFFIDLLKIPPGFKVGMDFTDKGTSCFLIQKNPTVLK